MLHRQEQFIIEAYIAGLANGKEEKVFSSILFSSKSLVIKGQGLEENPLHIFKTVLKEQLLRNLLFERTSLEGGQVLQRV